MCVQARAADKLPISLGVDYWRIAQRKRGEREASVLVYMNNCACINLMRFRQGISKLRYIHCGQLEFFFSFHIDCRMNGKKAKCVGINEA